MALMDIKVPDIGDFDEVAVIELLVKPGDTVKAEQSLITVESDKASMEIPSSHAGVVKELRIKLGDKVSEGSVVAMLEVAGSEQNQAPALADAALDDAHVQTAVAPVVAPRRIEDASGRYIEFCKGTVPHTLSLRGMKIVVDSAHGATYHIARNVFHELGADVVAIGVEPNGLNINDGYGATAPANLRKAL